MNGAYEIYPYVGVGQLRFGMTPDEIAKVLGPAEESGLHPSGEFYEDRFDATILTIYSKIDRRLVQVGFSRWAKGVIYKSIDLFSASPDEVLQMLLQDDGQPYESLGFIVLLDLGIALTGFHDNSEDERTISVFAKGLWDSRKARLKPFTKQ